jgi:branched-subunit amino acid aminotransferase/4-amino-4-deoxychorismate lyase
MRPMRVLAADSWLLRDGGVLGLEAHRARFLGSLPIGPAAEGGRFWDAAIAGLPRTGSWFPRLELRAPADEDAEPGTASHEFVLRVRPAPELRRDVVLTTHRGPDPRRSPGVKGPDIEGLMAARTAGQGRGADDVVLLAPDGSVAETATANLAWWRGEVLCVPDPELPQVPGVTVGTLVVLARALGIDVLHERAAPEELDGREIWTLNALHGIRIVTAWPDGPSPAAEPGRLTAWRNRIEALRRPLPEVVPA